MNKKETGFHRCELTNTPPSKRLWEWLLSAMEHSDGFCKLLLFLAALGLLGGNSANGQIRVEKVTGWGTDVPGYWTLTSTAGNLYEGCVFIPLPDNQQYSAIVGSSSSKNDGFIALQKYYFFGPWEFDAQLRQAYPFCSTQRAMRWTPMETMPYRRIFGCVVPSRRVPITCGSAQYDSSTGAYKFVCSRTASGTKVRWDYASSSLPGDIEDAVAAQIGSIHVLALRNGGSVLVFWGESTVGYTPPHIVSIRL